MIWTGLSAPEMLSAPESALQGFKRPFKNESLSFIFPFINALLLKIVKILIINTLTGENSRFAHIFSTTL